MACVTACKFSSTFNQKSSITVNTGAANPALFDIRRNTAVTATATSGQVESNYNAEFRHVYYYVSGGPY